MKVFFHLKKSQIMLSVGFAGITAVLTLSGCVSDVPNEDTENSLVTAAYNSSQCATVEHVAGFYGAYSWNSKSNYTTSCNAIDDTALGTAGYLGYGSSVKSIPNNKSACEATVITSLFYIKTQQGPIQVWTLQKTEAHAGSWLSLGLGGACSLHSTSFPPQEKNVKVRIATTVRQTSGTSFITLPFRSYLRLKP